MRQKLNENPLAQVALIGILLAAAFFLLTSMGQGGESASEPEAAAEPAATASTATTLSTAAPTTEVPTTQVPTTEAAPSTLAAPPPPRPVIAAWNSGKTVVILFVRNGGIDDDMMRAATKRLSAVPGVTVFVVPAQRIARYASIAEGVGVNRVPALVVLRPKALGNGTPTASVSYGFQSAQSIVQAVVDANYKGRTLTYHP